MNTLTCSFPRIEEYVSDSKQVLKGRESIVKLSSKIKRALQAAGNTIRREAGVLTPRIMPARSNGALQAAENAIRREAGVLTPALGAAQ
jgi:hypothetical protein